MWVDEPFQLRGLPVDTVEKPLYNCYMVDEQHELQPYRVGKRGPMRALDGRELRRTAMRTRLSVFDRVDTLARELDISKAKLIGDLVEEALAARDGNE